MIKCNIKVFVRTNCFTHSNCLSNKMGNSILVVEDINHKYIVVELIKSICDSYLELLRGDD